MTNVAYSRTSDGHLAARVAHLTFALVPANDGGMLMMDRYPARDPLELNRRDFSLAHYPHVNDEAGFRSEVEKFATKQIELAALHRQPAENQYTPWGPSHRATTYADGIVSYSTESHGGIHVSAELNEQIDAEWRSSDGWYEEDEAWAVVAFHFPHLFPTCEIAAAESTLINSYPDAWERLTGRKIPLGQSAERNRQEFMTKNAGRWMSRSSIRSRRHAGKTLVTAMRDLAPPDKTARLYLVDNEIYDADIRDRSTFAFVIDEARDQRVDSNENPIVA